MDKYLKIRETFFIFISGIFMVSGCGVKDLHSLVEI